METPPRSSSAAGSPAPPSSDERRRRVAAALEQVTAGVRRRQGELASFSGREELQLSLVELASREFVEEPVIASPRPLVGPLVVLVRKAVFHLFLKPYLRPMIQQQNAFNQAASALIQRLARSVEELARRLDRLERELDADRPAGEP